MDCLDDVDNGIFIHEQFGKTLFQPRVDKPFNCSRIDLLMYSSTQIEVEFRNNFHPPITSDHNLASRTAQLVMVYWDVFAKEGVVRPILGFEFAIDTGSARPVCCAKPKYGVYESSIILKQIDTLLRNNWIRPCQGPWGSSIVLAAKPHQEDCCDIDAFIWRMCVSYRKLNAVTLPFEYPIPRCDAAIENFDEGVGVLYFFKKDCRTGYHQFRVRAQDQEKLAFFAPNNEKYCYTVMPFGPVNAPPF